MIQDQKDSKKGEVLQTTIWSESQKEVKQANDDGAEQLEVC